MQRRKFVHHVGWTGLGILWTVGANGLLESCQVGDTTAQQQLAGSALSFVQISDSHLGFHQPANDHVAATLQKAINSINALPTPPAFVVHTGDITQLSKPTQFEQAKQLLAQLKVPLFTLPGEHDVIGDGGQAYSEAFSQKDKQEGLQAWDHSGVHYVSLTNVLDFGGSGKGKLGQAQIDVLAKDLAAQKSDTPLVIFSHIPLYDLYPQWGWATADWAGARSLLSRFSAVTVLSGHIHQVIQHMEGKVRFATATATAFPLPSPGHGDHPNPVKLPENALLAATGFRTVEIVPGQAATLAQHSLV